VPDGGLQTVVTSRDGLPDEAFAAMLGRAGVDGQPLSEFHLAADDAVHRGALMGFAAWDEGEAARAFARLEAVFGGGRSRSA
jgi:DNA-binding transcriptional MocR family regulator